MKNNLTITLTVVLFTIIAGVTTNVNAKSVQINKIWINDIAVEKSDLNIADNVRIKSKIDDLPNEAVVAAIERSKILQKININKIVGNAQILNNIRQIDIIDTIERVDIKNKIEGGDEIIQKTA